MHPLLARLLPMLVLVHLAGVAAKGHTQPWDEQPRKRGGGGNPNAQGRQGMAQGFNGAGAPYRGGVQGLRNNAGTLAHQVNPYAVLGNNR